MYDIIQICEQYVILVKFHGTHIIPKLEHFPPCNMKNVLGFRDYIFFMIFNDRPTCRIIRPMISFGARKTDRRMLTCLEFSYSNTAGTLLVVNMFITNFTWEAQGLNLSF
jgi:hypothetical protein